MPRRLMRLLMVGVAVTMLVSAAPTVAQDVKIDIGIGTPPVPPIVVTTPPQLVVVPGTSVYYAPDVPTNYFFYKGRYYTLVNNAWYTAPVYNGPWVVIQVGKVPPPVLTVPVEYYKIPPGHLKGKGPPPWAGHGQKSKKPKDK
jgi:WXXGXW repeat (2 copies)